MPEQQDTEVATQKVVTYSAIASKAVPPCTKSILKEENTKRDSDYRALAKESLGPQSSSDSSSETSSTSGTNRSSKLEHVFLIFCVFFCSV